MNAHLSARQAFAHVFLAEWQPSQQHAEAQHQLINKAAQRNNTLHPSRYRRLRAV